MILRSGDVEDDLPLVLRQTGQQRLGDALVERRVAAGQQLGAGVVHAGAGERHVVAAGCTKRNAPLLEPFRAEEPPTGGGNVLGEPKLRALGVLRLRPPTRADGGGGSSSLGPGSSSPGGTSRQT